MANSAARLIIESVCQDGRRFRPSDWIERISSNLGTFGPDHRLHYSKDVQPGFIDGEKCLVVVETLQQENPAAYEYIVSFAESNKLRVRRQDNQ